MTTPNERHVGFVTTNNVDSLVESAARAKEAMELIGTSADQASAATKRAAAQVVLASDEIKKAKAEERLAYLQVMDVLNAQAAQQGLAAKATADAVAQESAARAASLAELQAYAAAVDESQAAEAASTELMAQRITASFAGIDAMAARHAQEMEASAAKVDAAQASEGGASSALGGLKTVGAASALAVGAIGVESVKSAVKFQQSTEMFRTNAGATQAQVEQLRQGILDLSTQTATGPNNLADAMYSVVSVGYKGQDALNVMKQAALGAKVGNADLGDTTKALSAAMKALDVPASGAKSTMSELNAIVGAGNMHMGDLNAALSTGVVPAVGAAGVSLQSLGAGLAFMTDRGTSAEVAANRFRQEVALIESPSSQAAKALGAIGLQGPAVKASTQAMADALKSAHVSTTTLVDDLKKPDGLQVALVDLRQHMINAGLGADAANALIGKAFGGGKSDTAVIELSQNLDGVKQKYDQIGATSNSFGGSVAATQKTAAYQYAQMKADVEAVGVSLGTKLLPTLQEVGHWMTEGGHATTVLEVGLGLLAAATVAWTVALLANPVVLVTAAVVGLGVGLYEAYQHSAAFRAVVTEAFKDVKTAALDVAKVSVEVWHDVSDALEKAAAAVMKFLQPAFALARSIINDFQQFWSSHGQEIEQIASGAWGYIKTVVVDAVGVIWAFVKPFLSAIESVFKDTWPVITQTVKTAWDLVSGVVSTGTKLILDVVGVFLDVFTGNWGKAWGDIKKTVSDAWDGVTGLISKLVPDALNLLYDVGKDIINGLVKGLEAMAEAPLHAMEKIVGDIPGIAKSALKIFSPSKVMHEIGMNVSQGLADGITAGAPGVTAAAHDVVNAATGPLSSLGSGTGTFTASADARSRTGKAKKAKVDDPLADTIAALRDREKELAVTIHEALDGTTAQQGAAVKAAQALLAQAAAAAQAAKGTKDHAAAVSTFTQAEKERDAAVKNAAGTSRAAKLGVAQTALNTRISNEPDVGSTVATATAALGYDQTSVSDAKHLLGEAEAAEKSAKNSKDRAAALKEVTAAQQSLTKAQQVAVSAETALAAAQAQARQDAVDLANAQSALSVIGGTSLAQAQEKLAESQRQLGIDTAGTLKYFQDQASVMQAAIDVSTASNEASRQSAQDAVDLANAQLEANADPANSAQTAQNKVTEAQNQLAIDIAGTTAYFTDLAALHAAQNDLMQSTVSATTAMSSLTLSLTNTSTVLPSYLADVLQANGGAYVGGSSSTTTTHAPVVINIDGSQVASGDGADLISSINGYLRRNGKTPIGV